MTLPIQYAFEGHEVRVLMIQGAPWFVAADVCAALALPNTTKALERLDTDEQTLISIQGIHSGAGNPNVNAVNEPGLYSLVLGSRKPEAKRFKRWITHEVLPAIRKHGAYVMPTDKAEDDVTPMSAHVEADQIVSAGRVFRAMFTTARSMGMARRMAATRANASALRSTGVDLAAELGAGNWLAGPDIPTSQRDEYELQERVRDHLSNNNWPQGFTSQQLIEALELTYDKSTQTSIGFCLKLLGYSRVRQCAGANGLRSWVFVIKPYARERLEAAA
ncbi:BRO domain protein [Pseudomonas sp. 1D4]|uniref:BRO-N domain-containing protein n=1 Tax=Pseudomonas sp. 1D4 TaxID=1843691 RepID=UPI00084AB012|nr:Bro-N domain-containing protein [Pseudomonas sp. 1D4]OEC37774.1 BRO domain protein [Pseudomonas sp. 1D4]